MVMSFNINLALHQFIECSETTGCAELTEQVSLSKRLEKGIMRWNKYLF